MNGKIYLLSFFACFLVLKADAMGQTRVLAMANQDSELTASQRSVIELMVADLSDAELREAGARADDILVCRNWLWMHDRPDIGVMPEGSIEYSLGYDLVPRIAADQERRWEDLNRNYPQGMATSSQASEQPAEQNDQIEAAQVAAEVSAEKPAPRRGVIASIRAFFKWFWSLKNIFSS